MLTPLPGSPFSSAPYPTALQTDTTGRLFTANYGVRTVQVFTTTAGVPTSTPGNPFSSGGLEAAVHGLLHPMGFYMVVDRDKDTVGVFRINGTGSTTTRSSSGDYLVTFRCPPTSMAMV